jgi:catechol 2,3-dioxygenase-like lactoylglutathione lyase family enzyme
MKLDMLYLPVPDLPKALAFYRDTLGWDEAWREGDTTASLQMPGTQTQLMLDVLVDEVPRPGPIFLVDDVRAFRREQEGTLSFWLEPTEIPGGHWAGFEDSFGNAMYVLDQADA